MAEKYDRKQLRKGIKDQGWSVKKTRDGFQAVPPDPTKGSVSWHDTPSDWRADMNAMAEMKRRGFIWPYERKAFRAQQRREGKT